MTDGLQPERTGLAWQRTALSTAACGLLLLHAAARSGWGTLAVPAVVASASAIVLAVVGWRRERVLRRDPEPPPPSRALILGVALLVSATALTSLATFLR
ncbi:DUF202 domain-containing protein [Prauserella cavernicola]|uniref:DUF202 domain-containing protein n=1 Tax=Prauserella cavernicola TaxID=2800127 RepID=A0A934QUF7_9PSEU|nr:DUF202 domain-containing protein [Prauserella cavernicola]MBK1786482.1 DUF202 domain-containing protein [Prauserella cavernicola]